MADQQDQESSAIASTFPNPPSFLWQSFTSSNISRIDALRAAHLPANPAADRLTARVPNVPDDLTSLQPPPEPASGRWRVFGDQYTLEDKLPTLEDQAIDRLVSPDPSPADAPGKPLDRALELKRLAKSLLLNFLELTGILARAPDAAEDKIADLRTLLINMHHTLNEYRPHQARESVMQMMQAQLDRTRAETANLRAQAERARRVLEALGSLSVATGPVPSRVWAVEGSPESVAVANREGSQDEDRDNAVWRDLESEGLDD